MSWKTHAIYRGRRLPDESRPGAPLDTAGEITVQRFDDDNGQRDSAGRLTSWPTSASSGAFVAGVEISPEPSLKIRNHSPTGFNWGYGGSGPAQMALGLLLDFTGSPELAELTYQSFKADFVGAWGDEWIMPGNVLAAWLAGELVTMRQAERISAADVERLAADRGPIDGVSDDAIRAALASSFTLASSGVRQAKMRGVRWGREPRA